MKMEPGQILRFIFLLSISITCACYYIFVVIDHEKKITIPNVCVVFKVDLEE